MEEETKEEEATEDSNMFAQESDKDPYEEREIEQVYVLPNNTIEQTTSPTPHRRQPMIFNPFRHMFTFITQHLHHHHHRRRRKPKKQPLIDYTSKAAVATTFDNEQHFTEQVFVPSKTSSNMTKSAPMMKKKAAMPNNRSTPAIALALDTVNKPKLNLQSQAFGTTRFSTLWNQWSDSVTSELQEYVETAQKDSLNGYAWTLFCKVSKPDDNSIHWLTNEDELAQVKPMENNPISITHDATLVKQFTFQLHPTFQPHIIKQTEPKISRAGWGSFVCQVNVELQNNKTLHFDHELLLKPNQVGVFESTYYLDLPGMQNKLVIQVGNTYGMLDDANASNGDVVLANLAKSRANRRVRLEQTQKRVEEVRLGQEVIDLFVSQQQEKRLALGSVIAAILSGRSIQFDELNLLFQHGKQSLRCVELTEQNIPLFTSFLINGKALGVELNAYEVSQPCVEGEIDRFISHSWFDNAQTKVDTILTWAKEFKMKNNGKCAKIWCDKFCLKQTAEDLKMSVPCLPIYLLACQRVLLLQSNSFLSRLWCLTEVYTQFVMQMDVEHGDAGFDVIQLDGKLTQQIRVSQAKCSFQPDEDALRRNFNRAPGGILEVEKMLNKAMGL